MKKKTIYFIQMYVCILNSVIYLYIIHILNVTDTEYIFKIINCYFINLLNNKIKIINDYFIGKTI